MADETENTEVETDDTDTDQENQQAAKPGNTSKTEKPESRTSDSEAKLLKEVMKLKNSLKEREDFVSKFKGVDVDALLADKAQRESDLKTAEEKRLRDAGDFDTLKKSMSEEFARQLKTERDARAAEQASLAKQQKVIEDLTVGQSFSYSPFLRDETLLTPAKARKLYGDYFDIEDGVMRPYNKERGEDGREPMVTTSGDPLSFDEAIKRILEADPDHERFMRSKVKQGTGSMPSPGRVQPKQEGPGAGVSRIAAALKTQRK